MLDKFIIAIGGGAFGWFYRAKGSEWLARSFQLGLYNIVVCVCVCVWGGGGGVKGGFS